MPTLTGGCQCGAIRYALSAMPEGAHLCHCRMCQKAVGGPFAALAPVRLADFAWTRGAPARFDSSDLAYRHYCAACGTPLTYVYSEKPWIDVTIGSLDEPERVPPVRQFGVESRVPWFDPAALNRLSAEETQLTRAGQRVVAISYQHPDHETSPGWAPPKPSA
jgi:hypothetical protein